MARGCGSSPIPAGETEATIRFPIRDDADIEPAREMFAVTLDASAVADDYALRQGTAVRSPRGCATARLRCATNSAAGGRATR